MYLHHWGLHREPFPNGIDARALFEGAAQREALARLRFVAGGGRRTALLLGGAGVGKSTLLWLFGRERRDAGEVVAAVDLAGLAPREFYLRLATELGTEPGISDDHATLLRRVSDRLIANRAVGLETTLLLDGADLAGVDTLSHVRRVLRLESHTERRVAVVLAAEPTRLVQLGEIATELVDLRVDLEPWTETDTIEYLQMGLVESGADGPVFDYPALLEVYRLSGGVPRRVNRLADSALLIGAAEGAEQIDLATVQAAQEAVGLPASA